jgi:hypothetical protein
VWTASEVDEKRKDEWSYRRKGDKLNMNFKRRLQADTSGSASELFSLENRGAISNLGLNTDYNHSGQYSKTTEMHFCIQFNSFYMFGALLAQLQEALHKQQ